MRLIDGDELIASLEESYKELLIVIIGIFLGIYLKEVMKE